MSRTGVYAGTCPVSTVTSSAGGAGAVLSPQADAGSIKLG